MLTVEQNELMTRIGPGTRMGGLLRRYWQPVAALDEMRDRWTMPVRLLGEDLVLFKDRTGKLGLIGETCAHRRTSLANGIPTERGLRCPYHGWMYDGRGHCIEQPNEKRPDALADTKLIAGYPVESLGGLIFAYLGPEPAPLLPRYDGYVIEGAIRFIGKGVIPCNWLQIMENSVDPTHTEWLHGKFYEFLKEEEGVKVPISAHHEKIAFDEFPHGIIKRRLLAGQTEDSEDWKTGHPLVFPNTLKTGSSGGLWIQHTFQLRVPIDDTHTQHYWYHAFVPPEGAPVPDELLTQTPPVYYPPITDENGEWLTDYIYGQDIMAWVTQGEIADRSRERLSATDTGIALYRRMLLREMERAEAGEDPLGVVRDPAETEIIALPLEKGKHLYSHGFRRHFSMHNTIFSPVAQQMLEIMEYDEAARGTADKVPAE
jgi:5,5'-dehydrodivanillate O-demethylase